MQPYMGAGMAFAAPLPMPNGAASGYGPGGPLQGPPGAVPLAGPAGAAPKMSGPSFF